ncbi:hypothetical protein HU200_013594 [Digitaria exilis]|uniref:Zinc finger Mcm10/DnaG-type domain-containing protein n=1 Tax=Digitaria exilis TaxID=1010633 RepID=A0A835FCX4_9POAL|nr:hypothetical protein HU200_013594 [Digitaria exilis]
MASAADDLDLLLSLGEAVPETPPSSRAPPRWPESNSAFTPPRAARPGGERHVRVRDAVKDYLEAAPESTPPAPRAPQEAQRLRNPRGQLLRPPHQAPDASPSRSATASPTSDSWHHRDEELCGSDRFSGCWATAGVLLDKGVAGGKGFSVSVASVGQMLKMGVAADFGLCKGKRKDGVACTMAVNKTKGSYCKFHSSKTSQKYTTGRVELKGGNFQFASKLRSEGIYMVNRSSEGPNPRKPFQPVKVMSIDGLKKALSNADRVTTKNQSQGIRFLSHVTANTDNAKPPVQSNGSTNQQKSKFTLNKSSGSSGPKAPPKQGWKKPEQDFKRRKINNPTGNIVELDAVSSDDDEINIVLRR